MSKAHAATSMGVNAYCYDLNGNMVRRKIGSPTTTYNLAYDAESRMVGVSGAVTASFVYDGDNNRVKGAVSGTTVLYVGSHYEYQPSGGGSIQRKYYGSGGVRVAMRTVTKASNGSELTNVVNWLFGDHLGSTGRSANANGSPQSEQRYRAWGEKRYPDGDSTLPTTFRYTGQREDSYINLYWYGSRWYDPALSRFLSADIVIPSEGNSQGWDKFAYSYNNPVKYSDPDGHEPIPPIPYEQFIQQSVNFFTGLGMELIGTIQGVIDKGINTNGADTVFKYTANEVTQVLGVELKNIGGNSVNLGTLGKAMTGYGGSIGRIANSAARFYEFSNEQLRLESQAIQDALKSGNLQNALYTNAQNVSNGAANIFNNVYTSAKDNSANIVKGFGSATSVVEGVAQTGFGVLSGFLGACETTLTGIFLYVPYSPYKTIDT